MKLSRQANLIVDHLYNNQHITSWQAEGVYRVRRLASRITELNRAGYDIRKERCEDATGQSYTRYSFTRAQKRRSTPVHPQTPEQPRFLLDRLIDLYRTYCAKELGLGGDDLDTETEDFRRFLQEAK
ncbi:MULTISPECIES: helix-turn-helix domain-containing protein [Xanthomonas]|uniref:Winged helix-turn-helix domain-containing protein n=1 Tax=Xanthomonas euvesicatoria TaxID=456327 RepID=A0AAW3U0V2_XANEU|nr:MULTISPECIES: helix-turn-helix domain-containing protein [Xanthomonas]OOW93506.1 hypothetical protein Xvtr_13515 [Xanthomonas campestris pv. vitiscarnosae]KGK67061.1 hypothetical protein NB99_04890 [Xanthomonas citri pv. fuscans]MBB4722627.1 hypothetical protein [Xanthomonas euvesicatoria]MBB4869219.1 hypothetical protein [Xanthomonas euvesicatoria]OOW71917.1 hypothetical protein Xmar_16465 [Xanthomonas axonopodis pv. martyniicola]